MKRPHILPVFLVWLGCCLGQPSNDPFRIWTVASNGTGFAEAETSSEPTVSLARLSHRIPGKAFAAFSRALKLARRREWGQGAKELESAVAIDPDFADAHGNLGVHYLMLQRLNQAVTEFRRAIRLDSGISMNHSNLALAYLLLKRPDEAKTEAETAVSLDGRNAKGQYLLGFLLAQNPRQRDDAQKHLIFAAQEVPEAHLALGNLYRATGDESKASAELERYRRAVSNFKGSH
jgi:tetratricopeptide (TPR) repeat protein